MEKIPIVTTDVGMLGSHDIITAIVNPQIILEYILVWGLTKLFPAIRIDYELF